ncbi:MAG: hypothetical protein ABJA02_04305 [Acidobacteriota bacterium]
MRLNFIATLTLAFVAIISSQTLSAQRLENNIAVDRPDLSGKWAVDIVKSRFSAKKGPEDKDLIWTVEIRQRLPQFSVKMHSRIGDGIVEDWKYNFYTDGRFVTVDSCKDPDCRMYAKWVNNKLVAQTFVNANILVAEEHFELLPGGNTLQITFKLAEGRWGYSPNPWSGVIDEQYTDYVVFNRTKY